MSNQEHHAKLEQRIAKLRKAIEHVEAADDIYCDETTSRLLAETQDDLQKAKQITEDELSIYNAEWGQAAESAAKIRNAYSEIAHLLEEAGIVSRVSNNVIKPELPADEIDEPILQLIKKLNNETEAWHHCHEAITEDCL